MAATYALLVDVYLLLYFTVGENWTVITVLNYASPWILSGAIFSLLILLTVPDHSVWKLYTIPGVLIFALWYSPLFLPKSAVSHADDGIKLRVATFNATYDLYNQDKDFTHVFESLDADILGLQEFTLLNSDDQLITDRYPYQFSEHARTLYSRLPILAHANRQIIPEGYGYPLAIRSTLMIKGNSVSVYVVHTERPALELRPLEYDDLGLRQTFKALFALLAEDTYPKIILCDCNVTDKSNFYQQLQQYANDAWQLAGWGFGFTGTGDFPMPVARGDYIWVSDEFTVQHIEVWHDNGGSDHFPIVADLIFSPHD